MHESKRLNEFFEKTFSSIQHDNKSYIQENNILKENLYKLREKLKGKSLLIKTLKDNEISLKRSFEDKIKEKEEQIEKLMNVISLLPGVYKEKEDEVVKDNLRSFHKERKILKEMENNLECGEKKKIKNCGFRQKKLSWYEFFSFF